MLWRLRVISEPPASDSDKTQDALDRTADQVANHLNDGDNGDGLATSAGRAIGQALGSFFGTGTGPDLAAGGPAAVDFFAGNKNNIVAKIAASAALTILPAAIFGYCLMHGGISALGASLSLFGPFIIVAVWAIAILIVIGDAVALASQVANRKNARDAWEKQWLSVFNATRDNLKAAFPDYSVWAITRPSTHFADGFLEQLNRLNFLNALKEPLAIQEAANVWQVQAGLSEFGGVAQGSVAATACMRYSHLMYAALNGRYVGSASVVGFDLRNIRGQPYGALDKVFSLSKGDLGFVLNPDPDYPLVRHGRLASFLQQLGIGETVVVTPAYTESNPGIPPFVKAWAVTYPAVIDDRFAQQYRDAGRLYANAANFTAKMREPWGIGQTELSTIKFMLANGFVEGVLVEGDFRWATLNDGQLMTCAGPAYILFLGKAIYWRTENGKPNCCVRYDDAAANASLTSQKSQLQTSSTGPAPAPAAPPPSWSVLNPGSTTVLGTRKP